MNYKLRLVGNILTSKEEKNFIFKDGHKITISPVGDGKTVNISTDEDETYKTKGAEGFIKRIEKILQDRTETSTDPTAASQNDIFQILSLYESSGPRRK
jgi:hypothetical protein